LRVEESRALERRKSSIVVWCLDERKKYSKTIAWGGDFITKKVVSIPKEHLGSEKEPVKEKGGGNRVHTDLALRVSL